MFVTIIKTILISFGLGLPTIIGYYIYRRLIRPSKYTLALEKMGFISKNKDHQQRIRIEKQQEALLQIFQLAGYLTLPNLWHDLNSIGKIDHIDKVFEEIGTVIKYSNADQSNPFKFNVKYLRENLFKSDSMDIQDALDLILYIGQHAFTRDIGQERYELVPFKWIDTYIQEYSEAVQCLGLIDRIDPSLTEYDGCWIAGASRLGLSGRIIDFNNCIISRKIKIHGEILVLAGERELWANIDGIDPELNKKLFEACQNHIDIDTISFSNDDSSHIDEGKSYMMNLAQYYNIKLNSSQPFIQYQTKAECPPHRFPNRVYANYDINETSRLTETLMAQDLMRTYLASNPNKFYIIDTLIEEQRRPDTASTAKDAAERLIQHILNGDYGEKKLFVILLYTNNPYIERQTLATQRQVNEVLQKYDLIRKSYEIRIEGVGFSCKQPLTVVHSEMATLLAERYRIAVDDIQKSLGLKPKRKIEDLLFQTRNKNTVIPEQPKLEFNRFSNFMTNWFGLYYL